MTTPKCVTCHGTGEFYAATESVYLGRQTGYNHTYTLQPCPCTPRVVRARVIRDASAPQGGGRRVVVPCEPLKGKQK